MSKQKSNYQIVKERLESGELITKKINIIVFKGI